MNNLEKKAKKIAFKAHYGQFRHDGVTPYIKHPEAVANSVKSEKMKVVAWLHDVLEDTNVNETHLKEAGIPLELISSIKIMTKKPNQSYLDYILHCKKDYLAWHVKVADITHNLSTLDKKKKDKRDKYELALFILQN